MSARRVARTPRGRVAYSVARRAPVRSPAHVAVHVPGGVMESMNTQIKERL
jgi:hypothetical protein